MSKCPYCDNEVLIKWTHQWDDRLKLCKTDDESLLHPTERRLIDKHKATPKDTPDDEPDKSEYRFPTHEDLTQGERGQGESMPQDEDDEPLQPINREPNKWWKFWIAPKQ